MRQAWRWAGLVLLALGGVLTAMAEEQPGGEAKAAYEQANADLGAGKWAEAVAGYQKAIALSPGYLDAYNNLGLAYLTRGEPAKGRAQFEKMLELKPKSALALSNLGVCLLREGKVDEAVKRFDEAIAADPKFPDAYVQLAKLRLLAGDGPKALELLKAAEYHAPENREVLLTLANVLADGGYLRGARECYDKLLGLYPKDQEALARASLAYTRSKDLKHARELAQAALKLGDTYAPAHYANALVLYEAGEMRAAGGGFLRALELKLQDPLAAAANMYLGLIHQYYREYPQALPYLEKAYAYNPRERDYAFFLASVHQDLGHGEKAVDLYKEVLSRYPRDIAAMNDLGLIRLREGKTEKALEWFEQALQVDDDSRPALYNKALALLQLGKNKEAAAILGPLAKQAGSGEPYAMQAYQLLAEAAKKAKEQRKGAQP